MLVGAHGQTLDALQYLLMLMTNKGQGSRLRVTVDADSYRARRARKLAEFANELAAEVGKTGQEAITDALEPDGAPSDPHGAGGSPGRRDIFRGGRAEPVRRHHPAQNGGVTPGYGAGLFGDKGALRTQKRGRLSQRACLDFWVDYPV